MRLAGVVLSVFAPAAAAQVAVTLDASKDGSIYANVPGNSNGAGTRMFCGNTNAGQTRRALLAFDLSGIPACATITAVQLDLTVARTLALVPDAVALHRLISDWGEAGSFGFRGQGGGAGAANGDATWTDRVTPGTAWNTPGGDFEATASASTSVGTFGTFTWGSTPQLVSDVQEWIDDPSTNFGWLFKATEIGSTTTRAFHTREAVTIADRPALHVTYTAAAVASVGTGCTGGGTAVYTIRANGLPTIPNPSFALQFSGGSTVVAEVAILTVGLLPTPLPFGATGCTLLGNPSPLFHPLFAAGRRLPLPISGRRRTECVTLVAQGIGLDGAGQLVLSNALQLTFAR